MDSNLTVDMSSSSLYLSSYFHFRCFVLVSHYIFLFFLIFLLLFFLLSSLFYLHIVFFPSLFSPPLPQHIPLIAFCDLFLIVAFFPSIFLLVSVPTFYRCLSLLPLSLLLSSIIRCYFSPVIFLFHLIALFLPKAAFDTFPVNACLLLFK